MLARISMKYGEGVQNRGLCTLMCAGFLVASMVAPVAASAPLAHLSPELRAGLEAVMGDFRESPGGAPEWHVVAEERAADYTRKEIAIVVEEGDVLPAYLFIPHRLRGPAPAALCLHPTSPHGKKVVAGLEGKANRNYASELAARGLVTLAPDYPNMGDYTVDPYGMGYASTTMKAIYNHIRCVDLLQSLPEVQPQALAAIGHSLGGHNSIFVATFDPRIKVVVSSCGFNRFGRYYEGNLSGWSHQGYMPRIAERFGKDPKQMPFDFPDLLIALAPRPLFVNAPLYDANFAVDGVLDCIAAAAPHYEKERARGDLVVRYPFAAHDFPDTQRFEAYVFIEKHLAQDPDKEAKE